MPKYNIGNTGGIMDKIYSFFGHRQITNVEDLRERVTLLVESLIVEKEYGIFYSADLESLTGCVTSAFLL